MSSLGREVSILQPPFFDPNADDALRNQVLSGVHSESLETCAESIAHALNENVRYISYKVDPDN